MSEKLLEACKDGNLNQVKELFENDNIDIHYHDNIGRNSLMYACYYGHLDIVQYLLTSNDLKEHANIHDKDKYGGNAFILACGNEHLKIAQYLIIEQNMRIDNQTMSWLIKNGKKEVLNIIEKRDLYNKMNNKSSDLGKRVKQRKV